MKNKMTSFNVIILTILLLCFILLGLSSCNPGNGKCSALSNVEVAFPGATIYQLPDEPYKYIVIDTTGNIMYVQCTNFSGEDISSINVIKKK